MVLLNFNKNKKVKKRIVVKSVNRQEQNNQNSSESKKSKSLEENVKE